ncbi:MAG: alpha/beta hydrolase [Herpetosiphonaceae bacterium]|nr:alpha/beta hydrolase [Herpetosiphonaceae bacterium]
MIAGNNSPDSNRQPAPPERITYGDAALQFGDLRLPAGAGPHPVVILIHGGFWRAPYGLDLMAGLADDLQAHGIASWNIEYRRIGDLGGGWPGTLVDVAQATDHLRLLVTPYSLDLSRVVPVGHSAGGHLAFWLAARRRIALSDLPPEVPASIIATPLRLVSTISLAGVIDLDAGWQHNLGRGAVAELLGGSPTTVTDRYGIADPVALLPLGVPQCIIHGSADDRVPLALSEAYVLRAQAAGDAVQLRALPGVDHFAPVDPASQAWAITRKELDRFLA